MFTKTVQSNLWTAIYPFNCCVYTQNAICTSSVLHKMDAINTQTILHYLFTKVLFPFGASGGTESRKMKGRVTSQPRYTWNLAVKPVCGNELHYITHLVLQLCRQKPGCIPWSLSESIMRRLFDDLLSPAILADLLPIDLSAMLISGGV